MPVKFDAWTLDDATKALAKHKAAETAGAALKYYNGDHWQAAQGWAGNLPAPDAKEYKEVVDQIRQAFVFENAIRAVVNRHVAGVLGREPRFAMVPRRALKEGEKPSAQEQALIDLTEAALTGDYWDRRKPVRALRRAVALALLQQRAVLRLYVPAGRRDQAGAALVAVRQGQEKIAAALDAIYFDALDAASAGVVVDDDTKAEVGIFLYQTPDNKRAAELTYLADDGITTALRVVREDDTSPPQAATFDLGGRLLMFELQRDALITAGVISLQKSINHARTMIARNVNMAGFRERTYTNAAPPGKWVDSAGNEVEEGTEGATFVAGTIPTGAGASNWLAGQPIYNAEGDVTGYATPGVIYADPVDPTALIKVIDSTFDALLHEVNQKHVAISGDAVASAVSRQQARAEFEADLRVTANVVNEAGRWLTETSVNFGANLVAETGRYAAIRPEFAALVDAGPISADEEQAIGQRYKDGLLSRQGAMELQGVEDVAAEIGRIEAESEAATAREDDAIARLARAAQTTPLGGAQRATNGNGTAKGADNRQGAGAGGDNGPGGGDSGGNGGGAA